MPLVNMACPCGHKWEAIKSTSTEDKSLLECPECKGTDVRTEFSMGGSYLQGFDYAGADPVEKQMLRNQNKYIEGHAEQVLSGEMEIRESPKMPRHLRPQVPEHLRKAYY